MSNDPEITTTTTKTETEQTASKREPIVQRITKTTTISVALVLSLLTASFKAGEKSNRLDTIETRSDETGEVLNALRRLSEAMDKRLRIMEDRYDRGFYDPQPKSGS
mgnify:CR=1 FL=1